MRAGLAKDAAPLLVEEDDPMKSGLICALKLCVCELAAGCADAGRDGVLGVNGRRWLN